MKDHLSKLFNIGNDAKEKEREKDKKKEEDKNKDKNQNQERNQEKDEALKSDNDKESSKGKSNQIDKEIKKESIEDIDLELIHPNPYQPRKNFEKKQLDELAESIQQHGIMQPIVVRKVDENYEIVAGERRTRAARLIGFKTIPSIIKQLTDKETAEIALIENLQREDLNFLEVAEGYSILIEQFNLTQEELSKRVSKSQSTIANKIRLLNLDQEVRDLISFDFITERHARALLKLKTIEAQKNLLATIYEKKLNVRQTDELVEKILSEDEEVSAEKTNKKVKKAYKDMRIFLNSIRDTVNTIQEAGLDADIQEKENEDYVEVTIKLPKNNAAK